ATGCWSSARSSTRSGAPPRSAALRRPSCPSGSRRCRGKNRVAAGAKPAVTQAIAHLRPLDGPTEIDLPAAQRAAGDLLEALGVDLAGGSLGGTRGRGA